MRIVPWLCIPFSLYCLAADPWKTQEQFENTQGFKDLKLSKSEKREQIPKDGNSKLILYTPRQEFGGINYIVCLKGSNTSESKSMAVLGAILLIPNQTKDDPPNPNGDTVSRMAVFQAFMKLNEFSASETEDLTSEFRQMDKYSVDDFFDPPKPVGNKRLKVSKDVFLSPGPKGYGVPHAETRVVMVPDP